MTRSIKCVPIMNDRFKVQATSRRAVNNNGKWKIVSTASVASVSYIYHKLPILKDICEAVPIHFLP